MSGDVMRRRRARTRSTAYRAVGSITVRTPDGDVELGGGTEHAADVGPHGVASIEAPRPATGA
jgi:hypothetical protein